MPPKKKKDDNKADGTANTKKDDPYFANQYVCFNFILHQTFKQFY